MAHLQRFRIREGITIYRYRITRRGKITLAACFLLLTITVALYPGLSQGGMSFLADLTTAETPAVYASENPLDKPAKLRSKLMGIAYKPKSPAMPNVPPATSLAVAAEDVYTSDGRKIAFLTFDDGPSQNTGKILDILDSYRIKATFYLVGVNATRHKDLVRDIAQRGHALGLHSYSHRYDIIYANTTNLLHEIKQGEQVYQEIFGETYKTRLFRFPGGSFGPAKKASREAVTQQGYVYTDWNAINGDGESSDYSSEKQLDIVRSHVANRDRIVLLLHDSMTKEKTVQSLPLIIDYLKEKGFEFAVLK